MKKPNLKIEHLHKHFPGHGIALKDISFTIKPGDAYGLIGPNGAGKSTLVYILANLLKRDSGYINILGQPLVNASNAYKSKVGFVLDKPCLIDVLTAREYLDLLGNLHNMDAETITSRGDGLFNFFDLNAVNDHRLGTLSMGLRKRVALAAALLHDPEIFILDEPFSSLDPYMTKKTLHLFIQMRNKGKSILITSHLLHLIEKLCTHAGILNAGLLLYSDRMDRVKPGKCAAADSLDQSWKNFESTYYRIVSRKEIAPGM